MALCFITRNTLITLVIGDVGLIHDNFRDSVDETDSKTIELSLTIIVNRLIGDIVVFIPILTLNSSFASALDGQFIERNMCTEL